MAISENDVIDCLNRINLKYGFHMNHIEHDTPLIMIIILQLGFGLFVIDQTDPDVEFVRSFCKERFVQ